MTQWMIRTEFDDILSDSSFAFSLRLPILFLCCTITVTFGNLLFIQALGPSRSRLRCLLIKKTIHQTNLAILMKISVLSLISFWMSRNSIINEVISFVYLSQATTRDPSNCENPKIRVLIQINYSKPQFRSRNFFNLRNFQNSSNSSF